MNFFNLIYALVARSEKPTWRWLRYGSIFVTSYCIVNAANAQESIALANAASDYFSSILLIFLVLVCAATVWFVWRKRTISISGADYRLQIVGSTAFSAKERIVLIKVRDRIMMLGITAHQISLIKEFSELDFSTTESNIEPSPALHQGAMTPEN